MADTTLKPKDQRTTVPPPIDFGTSRSERTLAPYTFSNTGPPLDPSKLSWDLTLVDGNRQFPDDHAGVTFQDAFGDLRVSLCLVGRDVPTGSYSGSLTIAGSTLKPVQLPLTVNLKDNNWRIIWLGLVVASILAVFVKWWMVQLADSGEDNFPSIGRFFRWLRRQWVTVAISVIGAAGAVYQTKYGNSATFSPSQRWSLWSATFTAVTTASLLLTSISKAIKKPKVQGDTSASGSTGGRTSRG
ncbi:MAG: hypothetical protein M3256_17205 [Actinomycetota bacterium]|nr:hypothetical protein [Actinomycetota bacterium]